MPARRLREPVATTTARASPSTTKEPAYTVSPRPGCAGTLSPVRLEASTASACTLPSWRSAETRSPSPSATASPTTRSSAGISTCTPSRTTVARRGSRSRSRSAACSALRSWTNANRPFSKMTKKTATPSCGSPATKAKAPATQNRSAKKWTICAASCLHVGGRGGSGSSFGPSIASRAAASTALSPGPPSGPVASVPGADADEGRWSSPMAPRSAARPPPVRRRRVSAREPHCHRERKASSSRPRGPPPRRSGPGSRGVPCHHPSAEASCSAVVQRAASRRSLMVRVRMPTTKPSPSATHGSNFTASTRAGLHSRGFHRRRRRPARTNYRGPWRPCTIARALHWIEPCWVRPRTGAPDGSMARRMVGRSSPARLH